MDPTPVQKAVVFIDTQEAKVITDRPIPPLRDHHILVKVVSVALNPHDWKKIDYPNFAAPGSLLGCDYSGIVHEIGKGVDSGRFSKGDRICGVVHGGNSLQLDDGAFAEYIVVKDHLQMRIPDNLNFQQAATLGVGISTVGLTLYHRMKLHLPNNPVAQPISILIYGGSTATGSLMIQFAKLSGYHVVTTCSPHNFDFVKSLGADAVFDYKIPGAAEEIRLLTGDNLNMVVDTLSVESSAKFCADAISTKGGNYFALSPIASPRSDVNSRVVLGVSIFGEDFKLGENFFPAVPEDRDFVASWLPLAEEFLASGKVKVHPTSVLEGGLDGVLGGLNLLRKDLVSGQKLVYNVAETIS